jgi:hypothetical protein
MFRRACAVLFLVVAFLAGVPALAHALGVRISIRGAGTIQETSIFNLVGAECGQPGLQSSPTTPTGIFGGQCVPGSPTGGYSPGSTITYVATPAPGYRFNRWQSDNGAGPAVVCGRSDPPAVTSTYSGSPTCRFVITDNLQTQAAFVDDTDPAMSALSGPAAPVSGPASFTFGAVADPTLRHFECRVPGWREWATCSSGIAEDPPSGTWRFEVRAVDWLSNRSPCRAGSGWWTSRSRRRR